MYIPTYNVWRFYADIYEDFITCNFSVHTTFVALSNGVATLCNSGSALSNGVATLCNSGSALSNGVLYCAIADLN